MGASICKYSREIQPGARSPNARHADRAAAGVENPLVGRDRPRPAIFVRDAAAGECIARLTDGRTDLKTGAGARMSETNARVGAIIGKCCSRERCRDDRAVTSCGGL